MLLITGRIGQLKQAAGQSAASGYVPEGELNPQVEFDRLSVHQHQPPQD